MLTLHGVVAKLERAQAQIDDLSRDLAAFCDAQGHSTEMETGSGRNRINLVFRGRSAPLPLEYSIQIGESAYNMRSALDHLVWQLVLANYKSPSNSNEFPIFEDPRKFQRARQRKLAGVSLDSVARITMMQPFCKDSRWPLLGALQDLCNVDKHRKLHLLQLQWDFLISNQGDQVITPKFYTSRYKDVELAEGQLLCSIPDVPNVTLAPSCDARLLGSYFDQVSKPRSASDEPQTTYALRKLLTNVQEAVMFLSKEVLASPFHDFPKEFGITVVAIPETEENRSFNCAPKHIRDAIVMALVSGDGSGESELLLQSKGSIPFKGTVHSAKKDVTYEREMVSESTE